ncbi:hypothetical protein P152DRAFT_462458 [Eremomyces bilateralis CBS 781.70]|uniref:Uncharacterized protein n=1 Tax=Eremomyces bilateralis CBS 781.70 TaxID=1392243 RepID=A0A6G1FRP4_9PEZI|nr:uncharacterized protein P152DRAFT_462458 [Eremomyces bilateralis CBS 781.70]KAF1808464.1 hypothetical protein P152DRAFT_462458 [Eremomyces bilateralis CBS 781.70]
MRQFAVYELRKNGGNLLKTRIKHIYGDVHKLRDEIQALLELEAKNIKVNPVNGHIEIKVRDEAQQSLV